MKSPKIMHLFARTPVHVGAGNSVGAVDSPVMRERHTRIPIIPGSSLKGVLADLWNDDLEKDEKGNLVRKKDSDVAELFGQQKDDKRETKDSAGDLLVGEARVLAFPVRSAKGSFAWVTCPLVLQRYSRDLGSEMKIPSIDEDSECYGNEDVIIDNNVILEEYCLNSKDNTPTEIAERFAEAIDDSLWKTVESRLVIVSDEMFSYFVEHACEVVTRIKVDDETGVVKNGALFNQEQVPSETMFYAVLGAQKDEASIEILKTKLEESNNIIQVGGDETIGLGYCSVNLK